MNFNIFTLGGYGFFVWSAFIFTFLCFFLLYLKTIKELKKQEKLYLKEFKEFKTTEDIISKKKKIAKKVLPVSLIS
tara:strand:- start:183 stop:410 length:228 start_codon:yes stop_codon:yes gene_type:complete